MHASVTPSMCLILDAPFTERELQHAVAAIDASSCLGDDDLTKFFFTDFWDVLKGPLLLGIQHVFETGYMPPSMSTGIISLIPKGGDACDLRQWRPITLLSTFYKILAHLISARLKPLLPDLIHDSQTAFIQERVVSWIILLPSMRPLNGPIILHNH